MAAVAQRILIIKPSSLGDIIHALPVLAALRAAQPDAHIAWLTSTSFVSLLDGHPLLDEVIPFDRRHYGRMLRSPRASLDFAKFVRELRSRRFDVVLDLQGLFRSGFLTYASGARVRVGFAHAREFAPRFYTQCVRCPEQLEHAVDKNIHLAREFGLVLERPSFPLGLRDAELNAARALLCQRRDEAVTRFVAVIPGTRWVTKQWRMERLVEVINGLDSDGLGPCVLLGSPADRAATDQIIADVGMPVIDLVGRTSLRELAALLALADAVLCHDSGPMHIAAALNKPLVAIFGPTNPARTGPYSDTARVVTLDLECAPCYRRQCPLAHHRCMQDLSAETVLRHVREIISASQPQSNSHT